MVVDFRSFASALLLFVITCAVPLVADAESSEAGFRVVEPDLNLNRVVAGTTATGTFVFQNDSDVDVKILRAKPS